MHDRTAIISVVLWHNDDIYIFTNTHIQIVQYGGSIDTKLALPQTAQVAGQQGAYVARLLNRKYLLDREIPTLPDSYKDSPYLKLRTGGSLLAKPFSFFNLGSLAYIGGAKAIAEVGY